MPAATGRTASISTSPTRRMPALSGPTARARATTLRRSVSGRRRWWRAGRRCCRRRRRSARRAVTASCAAAPAGVTANLATGTASNGYGGTDTLANIENVTGSAFNDVLIGDAGDNVLTGGAGNDTLTGGGGNNTLDGGSGSDTVSYAAAPAGVTVSLAGTAANGYGGTDTLVGIENVIGSGFADTLTGDAGNNVFTGGAGNDTLIGGGGTDTAIYHGVASDYLVTPNAATPSWLVQDLNASNGDAGTDRLTGIGSLQFSDQTVALGDPTAPQALGSAIQTLVGQAVAWKLSGSGGQGGLSYALAQGASHGTAVVNADGTFSYTPTAGYSGSDSFSYRVTDGRSVISLPAQVQIAVGATGSITGSGAGLRFTAAGGSYLSETPR